MFGAAFVALWVASVMGSWLRRRNPGALKMSSVRMISASSSGPL